MFPFGVLLTVKMRSRERLVLSPSMTYRIGFAVVLLIALFVSLFGVLFDGDTSPFLGSNVVPLLFAAVSLLALLYNDSWIFDRGRGTLESRFGLLFLYRRRTAPLGSVRSIGVDSFRKGKPGFVTGDEGSGSRGAVRRGLPVRVDRLVARDAEGFVHVLDSARGMNASRLEKTALRIAEFCGVPVVSGD